jgi:hypothetical protein
MPAPTAIFALSLKTNAPEIAAPDLTEFRKVIRPFPKDTGERGCYGYLLGQMRSTPDRSRTTRDEFEKTCRKKFQVTVESFDYVWREANKVTGARWDQPGRPSQ